MSRNKTCMRLAWGLAWRHRLLVIPWLVAVALVPSASSVARAQVISDELLIRRPGFPLQVLTITEADEAAAAPGFASVTTSFLATAGTFCVQLNCQFGQSNVSLVELPGGPISDTVLGRVDFFSAAFDQVTLKLFSDAESSGGPDKPEVSDVTRDLFTTFPAGFSVVVISDLPEPSTWLLFATGIAGLLGFGWRRKGHAA